MNFTAAFALVAAVVLAAQARSQSLPLPLSNCQTSCPNDDQPVCGSDGKTYSNKCYLALEKCNGKKVKQDYKGRCRAGVTQKPPSCLEDKAKVLKEVKSRQLLQFAVFVPACTASGAYLPVQCLLSSRYCWCVDVNGKEVAGSRIRGQKPDCPSHDASKPKRAKPSSWTSYKYAAQYKGCSHDARKNFNTNIVKLMEQEFMGYVEKTSTSQQDLPSGGRLGKVNLLLWKFTDLDTNADYMLEPSELFSFLKKTKKAVPPKKCSRTFIGYCDQDENVKISLSEWYTCLGVQEVKKCMGEYLAAVKARQRSPPTRLYQPKCTSDGSYYPTQCHSTIGYCWCVDIQSGKPIPNTTKKADSLDCWKHVNKTNVAQKAGKKDCAGDVWVVFKKELLKIFRQELDSQNSGVARTQEPPVRSHRSSSTGDLQSRGVLLTDRQILIWKYKRLDSNHNKLMNSREFLVSSMKKVLGRLKRGRKCGRKVLTDCDYDKDKRISQQEWSHCLRTGHRMSVN